MRILTESLRNKLDNLFEEEQLVDKESLIEVNKGKNYRPYWDDGGYVYRQTYKITRDDYQKVLDELEKFKNSSYNNDKIHGSYESLKSRLQEKDGVIYPGFTAARFIRDVLNLDNFKTDRNVRFVIEESLTEETSSDFEIKDNVLIRYNGDDEEVVIPNIVKSIGEGAFSNCTKLTSLTIPDTVTSIGEAAFDNCTSLTSVNIPNRVTVIGDNAFEGCRSLTSITIPDTVTSIGEDAFSDCRSLTSIAIPDSITSIEDGVFWGCKNLTSITIPDTVTSIGYQAFAYCTSLTSITISNSIISIEDQAFEDCGNLEDIHYTGTKKEFKKIEGLHESSLLDSIPTIHYNNKTESLTENVEDDFEEEKLSTPRGDFKIYKGSWKEFKNEPDFKDWGFWFDAYYPKNADWEHTEKWYKIMHNYEKQHAIAVLYKDNNKAESLTEDTDKRTEAKKKADGILSKDKELNSIIYGYSDKIGFHEFRNPVLCKTDRELQAETKAIKNKHSASTVYVAYQK